MTLSVSAVSIFIPILSLLILLPLLYFIDSSGHFQPSLKMASTVRKIITTSKLPKSSLPYSPGVLVDKTLYIAGQIGWDSTGKVVDGIQAQTQLALENMGHVLAEVGATHKNVVKVSVLLKDINDAPKMNEVYAKFFPQNPPARAAYAVANLPANALIEIEAIAIVGEIIDSKL